METEERLRIVRLVDGRFLLVTERIVTAEELRELGIEPPRAEVPWTDPPRESGPEWLRRPEPSRPQLTSDFSKAMAYWREHLGGFDKKLPKLVPHALDEFGLERLLQAFDIIRTHRSNEPKYERLKRILREWRGRAGPGP